MKCFFEGSYAFERRKKARLELHIPSPRLAMHHGLSSTAIGLKQIPKLAWQLYCYWIYGGKKGPYISLVGHNHILIRHARS
jgi:hypothetical protein